MNEKEGQPWFNIEMYVVGICIILVGLYILCKGEKAGADGRLLSRNEMRPATDAHSYSVEMSDDRPQQLSPQLSPSGGGGGSCHSPGDGAGSCHSPSQSSAAE